ncbi:hypothetical protein HAHE_09840 [Haloferula helveola]|uniref:Beta-barrel porin 2 n=2 Tax=Haloferula helveola TaxID=490095 RepID=A0ABM7RHD8_9BACT|nr:hypothetical protein HAHE_09840 [Haloferula helveola]
MDVEYEPVEQGRLESDMAPLVDDAGRIDDRVEGQEWLAPRDEPKPADPEGWDLGLELEAAYDDNIFLTATSPESDLVFTVTPKVGFVAGQREDEGAYLRVAYRPSVVLYLDNSDESRVDHRFEGVAALNGQKSSVVLSGNLDRLGDATPDIGTQSDRTEYASELRLAWKPSEKLSLELAGGIECTDYDSRGLSDSKLTYTEFALRYAYSPKTTLVGAVAAGKVEVDGAGDQDFQRATARLIWQPREKLTVDFEVGVERRDYPSGSDTYPVLEGRIAWQPKEGTELFLGGYLREETSAVFPGQNIEIAGVSGGVSQRFGDHWTGRFEAGYESASYKRVSGTGLAGREDDIFFIQPSLDYQVNEHFRMGIFYRYSRNDSNGAAFGYDANQFGINASYDF